MVIAGAFIVVAAFLACRGWPRRYGIVCLVVVAVLALLAAVADATLRDQRIFATAAVAFFALGLLALRVILARSISLTLLDQVDAGIDADIYRVRVANRMNDALAHGLVSGTDDSLSLTARGENSARVVRFLYWLFQESAR